MASNLGRFLSKGKEGKEPWTKSPMAIKKKNNNKTIEMFRTLKREVNQLPFNPGKPVFDHYSASFRGEGGCPAFKSRLGHAALSLACNICYTSIYL